MHRGLIALCIETSVISRHSLPRRPANNQHPLCARSFSPRLSSLSPGLSLLSHACCHNDKTHSAIVPCCSPRTKDEAISSPREKSWKWRRGIEPEREKACEEGMIRWECERELVSERWQEKDRRSEQGDFKMTRWSQSWGDLHWCWNYWNTKTLRALGEKTKFSAFKWDVRLSKLPSLIQRDILGLCALPRHLFFSM